MIDGDPVRPAGISSTDGEHAVALTRIQEIRATLAAVGWPEPIIADSSNGGHLLYRVDLPNDAASRTLLEMVLAVLAFRFDGGHVVIDRTVYNAARIGKAYGTVARKGDSTAERPHPLSRLLNVPSNVHIDPRPLLEALA